MAVILKKEVVRDFFTSKPEALDWKIGDIRKAIKEELDCDASKPVVQKVRLAMRREKGMPRLNKSRGPKATRKAPTSNLGPEEVTIVFTRREAWALLQELLQFATDSAVTNAYPLVCAARAITTALGISLGLDKEDQS